MKTKTLLSAGFGKGNIRRKGANGAGAYAKVGDREPFSEPPHVGTYY